MSPLGRVGHFVSGVMEREHIPVGRHANFVRGVELLDLASKRRLSDAERTEMMAGWRDTVKGPVRKR